LSKRTLLKPHPSVQITLRDELSGFDTTVTVHCRGCTPEELHGMGWETRIGDSGTNTPPLRPHYDWKSLSSPLELGELSTADLDGLSATAEERDRMVG
jgi:hypothetical protein